jgi:FixJ family two-component response regulator
VELKYQREPRLFRPTLTGARPHFIFAGGRRTTTIVIVVAIVEDDPSMLKGVARLLKAHGFDTEAYTSAEAFLGDAGQTMADCLLLDINLGGISGLELQRQLSAAGRKLPIIFMTAVESETDRKEASEAGCIAYLRKPFPAAQLIAAIDKAVEAA